MPVRRRGDRGPNAWLIDFRKGGVRYRHTVHAVDRAHGRGVCSACKTFREVGRIGHQCSVSHWRHVKTTRLVSGRLRVQVLPPAPDQSVSGQPTPPSTDGRR